MTQKFLYKSQVQLFYCEECDEKAKIMIKDNPRLQHCNKMSYFVVFKVVLFMAGPPVRRTITRPTLTPRPNKIIEYDW